MVMQFDLDIHMMPSTSVTSSPIGNPRMVVMVSTPAFGSGGSGWAPLPLLGSFASGEPGDGTKTRFLVPSGTCPTRPEGASEPHPTAERPFFVLYAKGLHGQDHLQIRCAQALRIYAKIGALRRRELRAQVRAQARAQARARAQAQYGCK